MVSLDARSCSSARAQVKRLRPREVYVAHARKRTTAPRILHAHPGERGIEIVATVHEPGAGVDTVADGKGRFRVFRPDRRGETERAVIHERHGFLVASHFEDARD